MQLRAYPAQLHQGIRGEVTQPIVRSETIVDLCLPFFDEQLRRTFLGRYILHGGKLIGIRFSTTAVHPAFSAWPRHRAKQISVRLLGKQYDVLVGEIALYLINLRIGLLF